RPREGDRGGREEEGDRVERKGGRGSGGRDEDAADDRSADPRALPRQALDRVASDEDLLRDELGNDRAEGRDTKRADRSEQCVRNIEVPHLKSTREPQGRDDADDHAAAELGTDDQG